MTLVRQLALTLILAVLALFFVAGYGLTALQGARTRIEHIQDKTLPSLRLISAALDDVGTMRLNVYRFVVDGIDVKAQTEIDSLILQADTSLEQDLQQYGAIATDERDTAMLKADAANALAYRQARQLFFKRLFDKQRDAALAMLHDSGEVHAAALNLNQGLHAHLDYVIALSQQVRAANQAAYEHTRWLLLGVAAFAVLVIGGLGIVLYRTISGGLHRLQSTLQEISESLDLTRRASQGKRDDEIDRTASALNHLLARVQTVIANVKQSSASVGTASQQIAAGNRDLSARTEKQAAALQQTSASMDELTATVQQNAGSARQAQALTRRTSEIFQQSHGAFEQMLITMDDIADRSSQIGDITTLIDGIAFQTNILALNAAVEAARAGQHGKGFAVVATEVRALAQRAAESARQIKSLVEGASESIANGAAQSHQVGEAMRTMQAEIRRVATLAEEIAAASSEQGQDIERVQLAIRDMDEAVQHNVVVVEQAAAATQLLAAQAQTLDRSAAAFAV